MFTSSELTEYGTVRIRLRNTRWKFSSFNVAGKTVKLGEWTYYDSVTLSQSARRELVQIATREWFEVEAHEWPDARDEADGWVPLSAWRREEQRQTTLTPRVHQFVQDVTTKVSFRAPDVFIVAPRSNDPPQHSEEASTHRTSAEPATPTVVGDTEAMNQVLAASGIRPVNGEVATHLLRHLKRPPKHSVAVVDALVALGWKTLRLNEPDKFGHLKQHDKNGAVRTACRFCDP
jgi:hypothetical protein